MSNTTCNDLKVVKSIIQQGWCQYSDAYDKNGNYINPEDINAVCWCFVGAIRKAISPNFTTVGLVEDENRIARVIELFIPINFGGMISFNDHASTTKEMVLEVCDKAIAACE